MNNIVTESERWLPVPGYEGKYEVSDHGRVRSLDRHMIDRRGHKLNLKGKMLKPTVHHWNTRAVGLIRLHPHQKANQFFRIHKLVMLAFVGPRPQGMEICHWDGDASNNHLNNLRYDTPKSNCADKKRHGTQRMGETQGNSKLKESDVIEILKRGHRGDQHPVIAKDYGVKSHTITQILTNDRWCHIDRIALGLPLVQKRGGVLDPEERKRIGKIGNTARWEKHRNANKQ